jgi:protein O-mannosyl-transferase
VTVPNLTPCRRTWIVCLGLVLATLVTYWPVNRAKFVAMDDHMYIVDNSVVQAGLTSNGLGWAFFGTRVANYHPVTWVSHMLDCQLFGADPYWHHRINLFFHIATTLALFVVLRHITGAEGCSAFVAFLFALHPQHVESVAWISERKDVLSGLFFMLTLASYAAYVRDGGWMRYALTLMLFALGLLSKPMLVTLPCVLLLADFWPLKRQARWTFLMLEKVPFFLFAIAASVVTMHAQSSGGAVLTTAQVPMSMRMGNALVAYVRYLKKFFWPSDLAAFYPLLKPWPTLTVVGAAAMLLVITALLVIGWRRRPYLAVGWLWFLGMLVPVIGLVQVGNQAMADRYMYLPMIGLAVMVAWGAAEIIKERRWIGMGASAIVLLACAIVTADDVRPWTDSRLLFTRTLERTGPNMFTLQNLAASYQEVGDYDNAIRYFGDCVKGQPRFPLARHWLAHTYQMAKRYDEAREQLAAAIELDPQNFQGWNSMGKLFCELENWPAAAENFQAAVKRKPDEFDPWVNLAVANRQIGKIDEARRAIEQALKINPRVAHPWYLLGRLLLEDGKPAEALEPLARAVTIDPSVEDGHYQLGLALMASGHGADALRAFTAALQRTPNAPNVLAKLAWVLATHPDAKLRRGDDAVFLANRANLLTKSSEPEILDALAAALAEQKQFDDAATTAAQAATLARKSGDDKLAAQIESRAAQYRTRSAIRDQSLAGADAAEIHQ